MKRTYIFDEHVIMVDLAEVQIISSESDEPPVLVLRGGGQFRLPEITDDNVAVWEKLIEDWGA